MRDDGDLPLGEVVAELELAGYDGWYVLEQDTAILGDVPDDDTGPVADVRRSLGFLRREVAGARDA